MENATFWDHLDELRWCLLRCLAVTTVLAVSVFCMKDWLFAVVLAPRSSDFITYKLIGVETFSIHLMNTGLTEQFMIHLRTAACAGVLLALPYILYELFRFVSPGLYDNERHMAKWIVGAAYTMFLTGTLVNYFIVFPLTIHFLGTYQVSADIDNMLTIQSYVDTLITTTLVFGVVFELPILSAILAKADLIDAQVMRNYRRHAVVAILVVAAIITPTTDMFTLTVVSLPIWLLYEMSIGIVGRLRNT